MKKTPKGKPIPIRLDPGDEEELKRLNRVTGLQVQDLIRRALRFALPKFATGDEDILDYGQPLESPAPAKKKTGKAIREREVAA